MPDTMERLLYLLGDCSCRALAVATGYQTRRPGLPQPPDAGLRRLRSTQPLDSGLTLFKKHPFV